MFVCLCVCQSQAEAADRMLIMAAVSGGSGGGSRMSLYDSLRQTNGAASLIESLQSELKQREGEVMQLQVVEVSTISLFQTVQLVHFVLTNVRMMIIMIMM